MYVVEKFKFIHCDQGKAYWCKPRSTEIRQQGVYEYISLRDLMNLTNNYESQPKPPAVRR